MRTYRVGIVGAGLIAREHAISLDCLERVGKLSFFDQDTGRAAKLAREFDGQSCDFLSELVGECDIVWLCTPPFGRRAAIEEACRARRPLFCEKPLAISEGELQWVQDRVSEAGILFFMGQSNRFATFFTKMRELALDGAIGAIVSIWSTRLGWLDPSQTPPWRMDDSLGGGTAIELGVHEIDFIRWVGSEWNGVYALGSSETLLPGRFQDAVSVLGTLENGISAAISLSWASPRYLWQRGIEGTRGSLFFDDANTPPCIHLCRPGREPEVHNVAWDVTRPGENPSFSEQAKAIFDTLDAGGTPPVSLRDGAQAVRIALAIRQSIEEQRAVKL